MIPVVRPKAIVPLCWFETRSARRSLWFRVGALPG